MHRANCEIISKEKKNKKRKRKNCYYKRKNLNIRVLIKITLLLHIITYFVRLGTDTWHTRVLNPQTNPMNSNQIKSIN